MKQCLKKLMSSLLTVIMVLGVLTVAPFTVNAASFAPRTTAPDSSNAYYYSSNPFYQSGYGMPNCTCYAYGRAYELLGSKPRLSTGNAGYWWWYNKNNGIYSYGSTPKLGAIACWDKYDQNQGHVAVVEAIDGNSVTISESHYKSTFFDTRTITANSSNYLTSMRFLGYIYIGDFDPKPPVIPEPVHWYDGLTPVDLGVDFYAKIKNKYTDTYITMGNNLTVSSFDAMGKKENSDKSQIWHFIKLSDGSYAIKNAENNWCLDVEAGNNLDNLSAQPNGTNIQVYSSYNETSNQKFFIYNIFDSYYIRPAGTDKVVDLGLSNNFVSIWDYADNFDPQKFDIIKVDLSNNLPVDLGDRFYALIKNKKTGNLISEGEKISEKANDVIGLQPNGDEAQTWVFNKNIDGSYSIKNNNSNMYLDVEAGYNIDNLTAQPNGTNIQTYYQYNGTGNQKFYIYRMFNSYYIKPVGMNRIVDMGISNGLVAVWDYADDFDPQKFDIIRIDVNNNLPIDIGQEFYAVIKNKSSGDVFTVADSISEYANDVKGEKYNNSDSQIWKFFKENDGSYSIQNIADKWYLDVEAGNNLDNLSAQPNGTNIQTYYKYNGTTNQKFYVYSIFDSYYIKPAGTQKMVDMGLTTNLVAIWEYAGDFAPQKFDIIKINSVEKLNLNSDDYEMSLSSSSYTYDATAKTPTITIKNDIATLVKDTDYTVEYSNNINAGTATVTVTGIGNYTGTLTKTFIINKAQQTINATISSNTIDIGYTSEITASGQGTISYTSSNTNVATVNNSGIVTGISTGTAIITVTASGNNNYNEASKTLTVSVKNSYVLGDVNGDGSITVLDATNLQKYLAGLVSFSDEQLTLADTNGDGSVTVLDATAIQKYLANLVTKLG